jgi:hypothetical protein
MNHASGENKNRGSVNDATWPFSLLMRMPWSDCVVFKNALSTEELEDAQLVEYASPLSAQELRTQSDIAFNMLRAALTTKDIVDRVPGLSNVVDDLFHLLNADFFFELIGMCEINCSAVSFFGPAMLVLRDKRIDKERRYVAQTRIWNAIVADEPAPLEIGKHSVLELSDVLPFFDGIAMFDKISGFEKQNKNNVVLKTQMRFISHAAFLCSQCDQQICFGL